MEALQFLIDGITHVTWEQVIMWGVGAVLIYLAIAKKIEPALLLPMGFGAILINIPFSGAMGEAGIIQWLFELGIEASEAMPLLLFIGIGAMIDFGPLLSNPKLIFFGAAAFHTENTVPFFDFSCCRIFRFDYLQPGHTGEKLRFLKPARTVQ